MNCPRLRDLPAPAGRTGWPWTEETPPLPPALPALRSSAVPAGGEEPDGRPWPRISIVTPSFNQGRFVEETIRSVLLQGYPDLEYIVMDGGSTDATVSILKKYDPWLTRWVSEKDRGQSHAINKGMAQATGGILAYLNSDDVYLPSAFASVAEALAGGPFNPAQGRPGDARTGGSGWCTSDAQVIDEASRPVHYYVSHVPRDWIRQISRIEITCPQPCTFWTRDLWERCGPFDEEMYFSFDCDLFCKFLRAACPEQGRRGRRPVRCPSALAALRWHSSTKTGLHKDRMERDDAVTWSRGLAASGWPERLRARLVRRWARSPVREALKATSDLFIRKISSRGKSR